MRNRKSRTQHKPQTRRASTPTLPADHFDAKRQHLKKQRLKQQQQRQRSRPRGARPKSTRSVNHSPITSIAALKAKRERWAVIAAETQDIVLGDGQYVEERCITVSSSALAQPDRQDSDANQANNLLSRLSVRVSHNVAIQVVLSRQSTTFYPHYCESLASWATKRPPTTANTDIEFARCSTLTAARRLWFGLPQLHSPTIVNESKTSIGVLLFSSSKRPGGGSLHGGDEQEESVARLTSLVASLSSPAAQPFYKEHKRYWAEDGSGLHDHSMVYSPGVVAFRRDGDDTLVAVGEDPVQISHTTSTNLDPLGGEFIAPYLINVISSVPVNAAAVRAKHLILPSEEQFFEDGIRGAMKERMARVLRLFEQRDDRAIVLGAFGCGSSQNKVEMVAGVWAELLVCGDVRAEDPLKREARFRNVFDKVVFAVPGKLFEPFKKAFEMRIFEEQVSVAAAADHDGA